MPGHLRQLGLKLVLALLDGPLCLGIVGRRVDDLPVSSAMAISAKFERIKIKTSSCTHDGDEPLETLRDDGSHEVHVPHALIPSNLRVLENVQRVLPISSATSTGHAPEVVGDLQTAVLPANRRHCLSCSSRLT